MSQPPTKALQEAVERLHGGLATFRERVQVREAWKGATVWEGPVAVFDLEGHPTATRAYAWSHETTPGHRRFVVVLHAGRVDSPTAAVRASVVKASAEGEQPPSP